MKYKIGGGVGEDKNKEICLTVKKFRRTKPQLPFFKNKYLFP
jgi:hypothetical protein